jgi:hypothetical protein
MPLEFLSHYKATFNPKKLDLKPGVAEYIGKTGIFQASWIIEEGERYAGQWAMGLIRDMSPGWEDYQYVWVPEEDLSNIVLAKIAEMREVDT